MSYSSASTTLKTFATFSVTGDALEPSEVTQILKRSPTIEHRKNERYFMGERAGWVNGRTGVWLLSTDRIIQSNDFGDHLNAILAVLALDHVKDMLEEHARSGVMRFVPHLERQPLPKFLLNGHLGHLKALMRERALKAELGCVWFGNPGSSHPVIAPWIRSLFDAVPITIEENFDTQGTALSA